MRILNSDDLRADIGIYFAGQDESPLHTAFMDWVMRAWQKHFIKTQSGFLHQVETIRLPSFFKMEGADDSKVKMKVDTDPPIELEATTEWDIKDADAGTLVYYKPTQKTLYSYAQDVIDIRDYVFDLLRANPEDNLLKRNFEDTKRAAQKWHAEARKRLEERLAAEAEARRLMAEADRQLALDSTDWSKMIQGSDWWFALAAPFEMRGKRYQLLRLASQKTLNYESFIMDHCVDGYGPRIVDGSTVILSVRELDSLNTPLITAELYVSPGTGMRHFVQIRGIHNHDAEQTIKGISGKLQELMTQLLPIGTNSLKPTEGEISFKMKLDRL